MLTDLQQAAAAAAVGRFDEAQAILRPYDPHADCRHLDIERRIDGVGVTACGIRFQPGVVSSWRPALTTSRRDTTCPTCQAMTLPRPSSR